MRPGTIGRREYALAAALAVLAFVTFLPALGHGFLVYDDDQYVTANPAVLGGLTAGGVGWAFRTGHAANWHPLTWLSHMTDVAVWGLDPRGHHLTNLLLHAANAAVLFLALRALTGTVWPGAVVAAFFAVHPTRVEAVAWVAERKELLSALLGFLCLLAYARWARRGGRGQPWAALGLFAAGLLAKPMLVSLPFVLVLLDVWPLGRTDVGRRPLAALAGAVAAKAPFLALAAASCATTFLVQRAGGAVGTLESYPLPVRVANALVAYAGYLRRLVWPVDLAVFYPHPGRSLGTGAIVGAAVLFAGLCVLAWVQRTRRPYLFVGWFWFAGTLVPVIGLVQVGFQSLADRYAYVTFVGLWLALVWLADEGLARGPARLRPVAATAAGVVLIAACVVQTRRELAHWKDSETLFSRALQVTHDNYVAHQNLAHHLNENNRPAEALPHLEEALRIRPLYPEARVNLGRSLFLLGRVDEAIPHFEQASLLRPEDPVALNNLAFSRMNQGDLAEAVRLYAQALERQPAWAEVQHRAGIVQIMEGDLDGGGARLRQAAQLEPAHPEYAPHARGWDALRANPRAETPEAQRMRDYLVVSHRQAADVLARRGRMVDAAAQMEKAAERAPWRADLHEDVGLAWMRAGDREQAMAAFEAALAADPARASAHNNVGYLLFLKGDVRGAIARYREALRLAPDFQMARANLALAEGSPQVRPKGLP